MRILKIILATGLLFMATGCGNLSPRINPELQEQIDNQNGKIEEIEHMQNSMKNEMLNNQQRLSGEFEDFQQGLINAQGINILSGPAGLAICFGGLLVVLTIWYYREQAKQNERALNIMADAIKQHEDDELESEIVKMAINSPAERVIFQKLCKK